MAHFFGGVGGSGFLSTLKLMSTCFSVWSVPQSAPDGTKVGLHLVPPFRAFLRLLTNGISDLIMCE